MGMSIWNGMEWNEMNIFFPFSQVGILNIYALKTLIPFPAHTR
jgi:hypothetical protein